MSKEISSDEKKNTEDAKLLYKNVCQVSRRYSSSLLSCRVYLGGSCYPHPHPRLKGVVI